MKIAPNLIDIVEHLGSGWGESSVKSARAELRALLAVARAAKAWRAYYGACPPGTYQGKLYAALARLDKVSR